MKIDYFIGILEMFKDQVTDVKVRRGNVILVGEDIEVKISLGKPFPIPRAKNVFNQFEIEEEDH